MSIKPIIAILLLMAILFACSNGSKENVKDEPEYLSEEDYNVKFDTSAKHFLYQRYMVFENEISRCAVEVEFSNFLQTKLKTLMWRLGRVLLNSLDSASNTRELMLMDNEYYTFHVRAFNNNHNASISGGDLVKIHGEMIGVMYNDKGDGIS